MSTSQALTRTSLALGLACALLLVWLWRQDPVRHPPAAVAAAPSPIPPSPATPAPDPLTARLDDVTTVLLAALERAMARGDARPREAVLTFKDDAGLRGLLDRAGRSGLTVLGQLDRLRAVRVRFDRFADLEAELRGHAADHDTVASNPLVTIPSGPSKEERAAVDQVPFGNDTLAFLGADGDRSAWGRGTTIAILDTGVAADATFDLGRLRSLDIGLGAAPGTARHDGHGTSVAALAAGAASDAPGVAPAASILSIRVTDASGTSDLFTLSSAIVAAVDAGARIINISLGGHATGAVLDAAIGYASQQGALIVAAAGNDQAAQLAWPAADARVVSVGAVDKAEQQVFFSNSGAQLQLTAPGYGVQTAWLNGQRVTVDGTSASAPLVAGALAALISRNPSLTPAQAADLLARTANDAGQPGVDPAFGRGIANLGTAMNSGNPAYVDTAIASHFYDPDQEQMQFVVQNRSGRTISGMSLALTAGTSTTTSAVPSLSPGQTFVAKVPVNDAVLRTSGSLTFVTQLTNPVGTTDQVPVNNRRSSVLSVPGP